jgi:hypothetical protein
LLLLLVIPFIGVHVLTLKGQFINKQNKLIPGLTISIVNTTAGRSTPSISDSSGNFLISNIPLANQKFYLEIYWGQRVDIQKSHFHSQRYGNTGYQNMNPGSM